MKDKIPSLNLDEIISYYRPRLVLFAIKITGSKEDSEEIVQDVFVLFRLIKNTLTINYSIKGFPFAFLQCSFFFKFTSN